MGAKEINYVLLEDQDVNVLANKVSEYRETGWKLYGNPVVVVAPAHTQFFHYQAMVKVEETEERITGPGEPIQIDLSPKPEDRG